MLLFLLTASSQAFGASTITVNPPSFTADTGANSSITVCLKDSNGTGIPGISLAWTNYSGGAVTIGGTSGVQGTLLTGAGGCVQAAISANSVPPNQSTNYITFSAPYPYQATPAASLMLSAQWVLKASPTTIMGNSTTTTTLTLKSINGAAQPNVQIIGSCTPSGSLSVTIANGNVPTDSTGQAVFSLTPSGFDQSAGSVTCSFTTPFTNAVSPATVALTSVPSTSNHLAFGIQPGDVPQGGRLNGVTVKILKDGSNALASTDNTTQITLKTATLVCGKTVTIGPVTVAGGIANFTGISPHFYTITSAPLQLTASSSPTFPATSSNTFIVVANLTDFVFASGIESCSL